MIQKTMQKHFLLTIFFALILVTGYWLPVTHSVAFAQTVVTPPANDCPDCPLTDINQISDRLGNIVVWLYTVFWIVDVGFIIWAAFTLLMSGSNPEKLETAKKMLLYSLIAAAVVLLANGIKVIVDALLRGQT